LAWTIRVDARAAKDIGSLDRSIQRKIFKYLQARLATADDPESMGKALSGPLTGLWRYRVENYRLVCRIARNEVLIVVLAVGHRKDIYDKPL
jgi:mRNA interferase RelE/StbE